MAELLQSPMYEHSTEIPTLPPEVSVLVAHPHEGMPRRTVRADHRAAALAGIDPIQPVVTLAPFRGDAPACPWWYRHIKSWRVRMWLETGVWLRGASAIRSTAGRGNAR